MERNTKYFGRQRKYDLEQQLDLYRILGENMKAARIKRCFSVSELSSRAKVNRSTIYHIENGKPTISLFSFFNVLKVLELYEDVMNIIALDLQGNTIFKRKMMIKEATKNYKL